MSVPRLEGPAARPGSTGQFRLTGSVRIGAGGETSRPAMLWIAEGISEGIPEGASARVLR